MVVVNVLLILDLDVNRDVLVCEILLVVLLVVKFGLLLGVVFGFFLGLEFGLFFLLVLVLLFFVELFERCLNMLLLVGVLFVLVLILLKIDFVRFDLGVFVEVKGLNFGVVDCVFVVEGVGVDVVDLFVIFWKRDDVEDGFDILNGCVLVFLFIEVFCLDLF